MNTNLNLTDLPTKSTPYEDFINENMMKNSQKLQADSDCNNRKFKQDFDDDKFKSDLKNNGKMSDDLTTTEIDDESEIDLTTTGSPIDFSNNNNNNNNNHSDK